MTHRVGDSRRRISGNDKHLLVGVTGGIASGKTAVTGMLSGLGVPLIDFDVLSREVVEPGKPAWEQIVSFFGEEVLDEKRNIDRKRLSAIVFKDSQKRRKLESFTHPRIAVEYVRRLNEIIAGATDAIVQAAVPLLIEANLQRLFDKIVVVHVPRETQIERLMLRDGIRRPEAETILSAQLPIDEKLKHADYVIDNSGSLEETRRQVQGLFKDLQKIQEKKHGG